MTHFEYVSIAISLVYALAVADVLRALVPAVRPPARYWPHFAWLIAMVLMIAYTWWVTWNLRGISWTGPLFVYALTNPALLTIMVRLLTHRDPHSVPSFRDHFHANRLPFFAIFLVFCVNGLFVTWILGNVPVGKLAPVQLSSMPGCALALAGLYFRTDRADTLVVVCALLILSAALALHPVVPADHLVSATDR